MLNEQLDKQKEQLVREAGSALRQQEQALEQLSSSAVGSLRRPPVAAPSTTAQRPTAEMAASVPVEDSAPSGPGRGDSNNGGGAGGSGGVGALFDQTDQTDHGAMPVMVDAAVYPV